MWFEHGWWRGSFSGRIPFKEKVLHLWQQKLRQLHNSHGIRNQTFLEPKYKIQFNTVGE